MKKSVIFAEYGYRSMDKAAGPQWEMAREGGRVNLQAQANSFEALYQTFWGLPWFSGGFVWKWFPDHQGAGGQSDSRFTPQNKPAEIVIRKWYGK